MLNARCDGPQLLVYDPLRLRIFPTRGEILDGVPNNLKSPPDLFLLRSH